MSHLTRESLLESLPARYADQVRRQLLNTGNGPRMPQEARSTPCEGGDSPPATDKPFWSRPEREMQAALSNWLTQHGIVSFHLSPRAREKVGWPDLTFAVAGHPLAIEIKSASGQLTQDQRRVMRAMAGNGWQVYVFRPAGDEPEFRVLRTFEEFTAMVRAWRRDEGTTFEMAQREREGAL